MDSIPDGSVIITPNEIFRELRDTHDEVKSLGAQMQALTTNVSQRVDSLERDVAANDLRLSALEKWRWMVAGAAIAAGGAGSWVFDYLIR